MKVAVVAQSALPIPAGDGASLLLAAFCRGLVEQGHSVHFLAYNLPGSISDQQARLRVDGIQLHACPPRPNPVNEGRGAFFTHALFPRPEHFYTGYRYADWAAGVLAEVRPRVVFSYMADAVSAVQACHRAGEFRLVALVTDLDHLVRRYRKQVTPRRGLRGWAYFLRNTLAERNFPRLETSLLRGCDRVCGSAYHHAQWLKARGVRSVRYFPVPVPEPPRADERAPVLRRPRRVTLVGNVNGTATLAGLRYLQAELAPALEQIPGLDVRIVGGGTLAPDLEPLLARPWIRRAGYVEDVGAEYRAASVVLVPTPIPLGFRVRIAEAFAHGCCVVAHHSNAAGMPELEHGRNILLAGSAAGFRAAIQRCLDDAALRESLGREARKTYEACYESRRVVRATLEYALADLE